MKGAKGLLVSITGGKDLTLYEVDEAASRIRGEVDPDANIIVGATFDETLEGIIRVSVVATGIDMANASRPSSHPEQALKELAGKMRAETVRIETARAETSRAAERIERVTVPMAAPAKASAAAVESAAQAAVAAAILPSMDDVSIRPMPVKPSLFEAPAES